MPRDIEGRLRRLERRRAVQAFDPYEAHMIGIRCYEQGLELPADLTGEEREIAAAVLQTLTFYDSQWNDLPLPLESLRREGAEG